MSIDRYIVRRAKCLDQTNGGFLGRTIFKATLFAKMGIKQGIMRHAPAQTTKSTVAPGCAPTDVICFKHSNINAGLCQMQGGTQAREATANDGNIASNRSVKGCASGPLNCVVPIASGPWTLAIGIVRKNASHAVRSAARTSRAIRRE